MFHSFLEIEEYVLKHNLQKRVALACAHDADALGSVVTARRRGIIAATLIGDGQKIRTLLETMGEDENQYHIIEQKDPRAAAQTACKMVSIGEADMPMKGKMQTSEFMRALLDKSLGFIPEKGLLCQATVLEFAPENRLMVISDCAVNVAPDYAAKLKITQNAVHLAHQLGMECPRVAIVTPLEMVNPNIPSTVDAAMLNIAAQRGQIPGCIVDGPLGLDNAVNLEAARSKGIGGEVAGRADVLIMPDLAAGNIFTKSLHYFAHLSQSGTVTGAKTPVVMTSRTDTEQDKYHSILVSVLQAQK